MGEDRDTRISELYQQSSQETPPAHVDRAVMDRARKFVRRRVHSPFGNNWVAGGAMVGVALLSVFLLLDVPQQPAFLAPAQNAIVPHDVVQPKSGKEIVGRRILQSDVTSEAKDKREAPAAPKARLDFYELLPAMEVDIPEEVSQERMKQSSDSVKEKSARAAAKVTMTSWYLQAGSFRDKSRAVELQKKLTVLGFRVEIQEITINNTEAYHRVRVGPFTDLDTLDQSRHKLDGLGIKTQTVGNRE